MNTESTRVEIWLYDKGLNILVYEMSEMSCLLFSVFNVIIK